MNSNRTLSYYIDLFLENSYIKNKLATFTSYRYTINKHIYPFWKDYYPFMISDYLVITFVEKLNKEGLTNKSIKEILLILRGIFKLANINITIPFPKIEKNNIKIFNKEDQELLEKTLVRNINYFNFSIYLALYTGIRIGELCSLKYSDINRL